MTCVDMVTPAIIHYTLHPEMLIQYIKRELGGESRNVNQIIKIVLPLMYQDDGTNIPPNLTFDVPFSMIFEEDSDMIPFSSKNEIRHLLKIILKHSQRP